MLTVTHALIDYWKRLPAESPAARRRCLDAAIERIRAGADRRDALVPFAIGDVEGNVLWLSRSDGELAAVNKVGSKAIVAAPVFAGGLVVVQTSAGELFAFRPE